MDALGEERRCQQHTPTAAASNASQTGIASDPRKGRANCSRRIIRTHQHDAVLFLADRHQQRADGLLGVVILSTEGENVVRSVNHSNAMRNGRCNAKRQATQGIQSAERDASKCSRPDAQHPAATQRKAQATRGTTRRLAGLQQLTR
jgi:hypothetical protein